MTWNKFMYENKISISYQSYPYKKEAYALKSEP